LLVVTAFALAGGAAFAGDQAPNTTVKFTTGKPSPFAATRFDGEYYSKTKRIYFLGFRTTGGATDGSIWYYDTKAKTYTDTALKMPTPVSNYGIAALKDANGIGFYVFGGRDANATIVTDTQVFYPATNTTAVITTDPYPGKTPANCIALPAMGVAVVGNKAAVLGGASFAANGCADDNSAQTWIFDPMAAAGSRWTQGPNLHLARGYITPGVLGNKVYAIGGDTNAGGVLTPQTTVESWVFGSGSWDDAGVADLPQACDESQAFGFTKGKLANTITLAGCGQWPNALPDVMQYSSTGNAWSTVGTLNEARRNHAGALIGKGTMFILGGYGQSNNFADAVPSSELGKAGKASGSPAPGAPAGTSGSRDTN
jgi:hypothetical protein